MIRKKLVYLICFLFYLLVVNCITQANTLYYQVSSEKVVLMVNISSDEEFRVWQTTNPMKVIIDLTNKYTELESTINIGDVALERIRIAGGPGDIGTRIVLDFNYHMPNPTWIFDQDGLKVEVDKIFVRRSVRTISQGVRYGHERRGIAAGPLIINFLEVDLNDPEVEVKSLLAGDQIYGSERVSSMAIRGEAIAAVNGLYFAADGRPLGLLAIDGRLISEPYANRTAIRIKPGEVGIGAVGFWGEVQSHEGDTYPIAGINRPRGADELIIYTTDYGSTSRTNQFGMDLIVVDDHVTGIAQGNVEIPSEGSILSGHGLARDFLHRFEVGDTVNWSLELSPNWLAEGFNHIIGGGPRLVENGVLRITGELELFQPNILLSRAPRTALGITQDNRLLLVTVNGRKTGISVGMTLPELAQLMIELGAVDAMNLDGGGSTTMVIRDRVLNLPSDGVERPVSNGLLVITPESRR